MKRSIEQLSDIKELATCKRENSALRKILSDYASEDYIKRALAALIEAKP
jgi:hypothetical protein